jgi:hypothetical protein
MTSPKAFATIWLIFFDTHVWIAKADEFDLIPFLGKHCKLFVPAARSLWLVIARKRFASVTEATRRGSFYSSCFRQKLGPLL